MQSQDIIWTISMMELGRQDASHLFNSRLCKFEPNKEGYKMLLASFNFLSVQDAMDLISGRYNINRNGPSPFQLNGFETLSVSIVCLCFVLFCFLFFFFLFFNAIDLFKKSLLLSVQFFSYSQQFWSIFRFQLQTWKHHFDDYF